MMSGGCIKKCPQDSWLPRQGVGRGNGWTGSLGLVDANDLHLEQISHKVLLYSTGNYNQSPGINHNRKGYLKKKKYICV